MSKKITIALAGNPNVGKSTLFSAITGARQHVGNWPGVTVEKKSGVVRHSGCEIEVVDLPGTYSLTAYSLDEVIARDFIIDGKPDVVVQVVDATSLERNLYLTTQLSELGVPLVIALNMSDMAEQRGDSIDRKKMAEYLEIPVVRTVGSNGVGIGDLLDAVVREAGTSPHHEHSIGYGDPVEEVIADLINALRLDRELTSRYPPRWLAVRLLEGDEDAEKKIRESTARDAVYSILSDIDAGEYEAMMADRRYEVISAVLPQVCTTCVREMTASDLIDRVVTNRYLGIPIFLALMWGAFELTFTVASPFMAMIEAIQEYLAGLAAGIQPEWLATLVGDGLIGGVGSVLIFLPNIFILLFLLAVLEDSGYLARAAFVMDRLMYSIGLPGRSFIPMLVGFGCNVPAIMATRTIEDKNDRLITILINPFISCGARLPVYVLFAAVFFAQNSGAAVFSMYLLGIVTAILLGIVLKNSLFKGKEQSTFVMELPPYRLPTLRGIWFHTWERTSAFLRKAWTVIMATSILLWLLMAIPAGGQGNFADTDVNHSVFATVTHAISPAFAPLGFGSWEASGALVTGFVAKEVVVSTMSQVYAVEEAEEEATETPTFFEDLGEVVTSFVGATVDTVKSLPLIVGINLFDEEAEEEPSALMSAIKNGFESSSGGHGALAALAFMVFVLIYTPCMVAVAAERQELGMNWTWVSVFGQLALAWLMALIVFQGGKLLGLG